MRLLISSSFLTFHPTFKMSSNHPRPYFFYYPNPMFDENSDQEPDDYHEQPLDLGKLFLTSKVRGAAAADAMIG